jgi:hypothetical protein
MQLSHYAEVFPEVGANLDDTHAQAMLHASLQLVKDIVTTYRSFNTLVFRSFPSTVYFAIDGLLFARRTSWL